MTKKQAQGRGVLRCASHSSPSDPLTTDRRKTHPPTTNRLRGRGADHQRGTPYWEPFARGQLSKYVEVKLWKQAS